MSFFIWLNRFMAGVIILLTLLLVADLFGVNAAHFMGFNIRTQLGIARTWATD